MFSFDFGADEGKAGQAIVQVKANRVGKVSSQSSYDLIYNSRQGADNGLNRRNSSSCRIRKKGTFQCKRSRFRHRTFFIGYSDAYTLT